MQAARGVLPKRSCLNVKCPKNCTPFWGSHLATAVTNRKRCILWEWTGHLLMCQFFEKGRSISLATFLQPHCCLSVLHMH